MSLKPATEWRKIIAHGETVGMVVINHPSPGRGGRIPLSKPAFFRRYAARNLQPSNPRLDAVGYSLSLLRGYWSLKGLNDAAHFIVVAGKEKFQGSRVVPKQQAHLQPGAALENVFPQSPDGNAAVSMRVAETIRNCLKRRFNTREIRLAQTFERSLKARGQDNGGFSHV